MKKFNSIREESLLEKLKASDPTGEWISDFVHSDNPKFAGKSKKERIRMALGASYAAKRNEEAEQVDEEKQRVQVTVTDPNHAMVSKRNEKMQKFVRISGDKESSVEKAKKHFSKQGYRVHGAEHVGTVKEEVDKGISRAVDKLAKEAVQIEEGSAQSKLYGIQQKLRQKSKLPNPEYYKEMGKAYDIKDDAERMTKQSEIKKKYGVSEASQLDQLKAMRDNPQWQKDPEHKAQLDKRVKMAQDRQDLDAGEVVNKAGKPIPVLTPDKYKEKNPNFMKESDSREDKGEYDYEGDMAMSDLRSIMHNAKSVHDMLKPNTNLPEWCQSKITLAEDYVSTVANYMQATMSEETNSDFVNENSNEYSGTGVSKDMQMAKDLADSNARKAMMQKKYGETYTDKELPRTTSRYEFTPGEKPGTYRATAYHKEVSEAKKMKGPDPCWDDYKMIGTKMKNGKQVPNCVPEQVQLEEIKRGLYANIHAKRKRIAKGSGERMRKPGTKGAPTAQAFRDSAKTAKK
jgi:hypothetical protein